MKTPQRLSNFLALRLSAYTYAANCCDINDSTAGIAEITEYLLNCITHRLPVYTDVILRGDELALHAIELIKAEEKTSEYPNQIGVIANFRYLRGAGQFTDAV